MAKKKISNAKGKTKATKKVTQENATKKKTQKKAKKKVKQTSKKGGVKKKSIAPPPDKKIPSRPRARVDSDTAVPLDETETHEDFLNLKDEIKRHRSSPNQEFLTLGYTSKNKDKRSDNVDQEAKRSEGVSGQQERKEARPNRSEKDEAWRRQRWYGYMCNAPIAQRIWDRVLTDDQRKKLGNDFVKSIDEHGDIILVYSFVTGLPAEEALSKLHEARQHGQLGDSPENARWNGIAKKYPRRFFKNQGVSDNAIDNAARRKKIFPDKTGVENTYRFSEMKAIWPHLVDDPRFLHKAPSRKKRK